MAKDTETRLREFTDAMRGAAGDNLAALLLRGSVGRGDFNEKRSELNVVVILHDTSATALRPLGDIVAKWVRQGDPTPVIFSEDGWRRSTDVFPIELEDMREAHRLLHGSDPFDGLTTEPADVRHELEREARGKLIQLRAEYTSVAANGKWLGALLLGSAKTFFVLFRALVRCKGESPPQETRALVRAAATIAEFDASAFDWVVDRLAGRKTEDLTAYDTTGARYLEAIEQFVHYVDTMKA